MVDITKIPVEELEKDLNDSLNDIKACQAGLLLGIEEVLGVSVQYRLEQNEHFVEVITAELKRRGLQPLHEHVQIMSEQS